MMTASYREPDSHFDPPEDDDGGYGDWLYEQHKDKELDAYLAKLDAQDALTDAQDALTDYEKRINAGVYDVG
jgi:hypothetical protein